MAMRSPEEMLDTARRKWPAVLRAEATGEDVFPLKLPFGRPSTTEDFGVISPKITALYAAPYAWRIQWEIVETRKWGQQRWPVGITFETPEALASTLGKTEELLSVREVLRNSREQCPLLEPWLQANAHRLVDYFNCWNELLSVCIYFDANPAPKCYPRQVPVTTDTKFIERHAGILRELLDVILQDRMHSSSSIFPERFGLLIEPPQLRFRFLDPLLQATLGWPVAECTVPISLLRELHWNVRRVLVVENRDVFLCLPSIPDTLAIFGAGKAVTVLTQLPWLKDANIYYWGDCDEAGFGILSGLRSSFPQVRSVMMDLDTWQRWQKFAVQGKRDRGARCTNLTPTEREAFEAVAAGPWVLEQERIPPVDAERMLRAACDA